MLKSTFKTIFLSLVFTVTSVLSGLLLLKTLANELSVNSGDTLNANLWNSMVSSLVWNSNGGNIYYNSGNVGIGTNSPNSKLTVNGEIRLWSTNSSCNSTLEGGLRYNSSNKSLELCNGTVWTGFQSTKTGTYETPGESCKDILDKGGSSGNGLYFIKPLGASSSFQVYCDMITDGGGWTIVGINGDVTSNSCEISLKSGLGSCGTLTMTNDRRPSFFPTWSKLIFVVYNANIFTERKMYDKISVGGNYSTLTTNTNGSYESSDISTTYGRINSSLRSNNYILVHNTASLGSCTNPHPDLLKICYTPNACYSSHDASGSYGFDDYQDGCGLSDSWQDQAYRGYRSYIMVR